MTCPVVRRRHRTLVLVATGLALLVAAPAAAHPGFQPAQVAGGEPTTLTLGMAHGCTTGEPPPPPGEEVQPTVVVAVQVPDAVRDVEPVEEPGWTLDTTTDDTGRVTTFEWRVEPDTPPEEAPSFEVTVTVDGDAGEEVFWPVFQECTEDAYRWIDTEGRADADPAVRLTLTSSSVAPSPSAAATPTSTPTPPAAAGDAATPSTPAPTPTPSSTPSEPSTPRATATDTATTATAAVGTPWVAVVVVLAVVVAGAVLLQRHRGEP